MNSEEKLLRFKIEKGFYGSLGHYYGFDFACKDLIKQLETILNEKNQKEFLIDGDDKKYTTESIMVFLKETEKEWMEFYNQELKKQKDSIQEKRDWVKTNCHSLPSVKAFVSLEHLGDLAAFYSFETNEFIKVWLAEKGYNVTSIEEVPSNPSNTFILLDNNKEFVIESKAKVSSNGIFSYSYLEFYLEEKQNDR